MTVNSLSEVERLQRINKVLMERVENDTNHQGNAFSLFQTALSLEGQVRRRTAELTSTLTRLEGINHELETAKEQAEQANRSKTRFLAAASHDVMQPLNAALLSLSLLADQQTTPEGKRLVTQIDHSLTAIEELLRTLLDISKFDAGVVQPARSAVSLGTLIDGLVDDFAPIAAGKGLRLHARTRDIRIRSDKTMLRRILQNLISNAIRYTDKGGVLIGVRDYGRAILVDVIDSGEGIAEHEKAGIFEEFHRIVRKNREEQPGFGLGLSIVKRMVDALDYRLDVSSRPGHGSRFRLIIGDTARPEQSLDTAPVIARAANGASLEGKNVLLIENDMAVTRAMKTLLDSWGAQYMATSNIDDTLAVVLDRKWIPDIIIADQHLDNDELGTSAVAAIRALVKAPVPAVIVTANPSEEVEFAVRDMRMELMLKPVKPAQLRALASHLLSE